jgi:regulator of PEP synthase PpsR (kinase-PPPase family)
MKRHVFFISDRTGITAENLGASLLTQFPEIDFQRTNIPFVSNEEAAYAAIATIRDQTQGKEAPIVFSTLTDMKIQTIIADSTPYVFDLFGTFIGPLEDALGVMSSHKAGKMHGIGDTEAYEKRVHAVNFTLGHDDGLSLRNLKEADIVLVGVSRCGKTPTCLYLAMQYSLKAANYPLVHEDLENSVLPAALRDCRSKLYGLTINPEQLSRIRHERRPTGEYSQISRCQWEVSRAEKLFREENMPFIDTTTVSIEEIAATAGRDMGLH